MTGRRQPLCVVLLLVILVSAFQVATPEPKQSPPGQPQVVQENSSASAVDESATEGQDSGGDQPSGQPSAQEAVYPSSMVSGPRPSSGPSPQTNSPTVFDYHNIAEAQSLGVGYPTPSSPAFNGSNVRVSVLDYGMDIGHPDLSGSQLVEPSGTYAGWPVAFDAKSMGIWLRDKKYEGTWYANTTRKGNGTFEVTHSVLVDGRKDFGPSELLGKADFIGTSSIDPDGDKGSYDLTELYVTHDEKFWYFGWPVTKFLNENITYGLLIDVDNETSGTTSVPEGMLVDTNTTHSGTAGIENPLPGKNTDLAVSDVAASPDGTMVATTAGDKHVKVWSLPGGTRLLDLTGHLSSFWPYSLAWSPDGRYLASRDSHKVFIWDIPNGGTLYNSFDIPSTPQLTDFDTRFSSSIAFSPNGTWLAIGGVRDVHVYDVPSKKWFGNVKVGFSATIIRSVAFNPTDPKPGQIVVGLDTALNGDKYQVRIFDLNSTNLAPAPPISYSSWNSTRDAAFGGHTQPMMSVAWSPNGARIVSTSQDNTAKLWEPPSPFPLKTMSQASWVLGAAWENNPVSPKFATVSYREAPSPKSPLKVYDYNGNLLNSFDLNRTTFAVDWAGPNSVFTASLDLSARMYTTSGTLQKVLVSNKPDFAVMIDAGMNYSLKDRKYVKVVYNGTFYQWNGAAWVGGYEVTKTPINGTQAFFGIDELFVELGVPVSILGHPRGISAEMFSASNTTSHAEDTTPLDYNVFDMNGDGVTDKVLDWTRAYTSLAGFQYTPVRNYRTNTTQIRSVSGTYHFGYHPSPQLSLVFGSLGVLVVDPNQNSTYERVYLDMNNDKQFDNTDVVVDKTHPIATIDNVIPKDGIPDLSAGMIYFIADGVNYIPYSERFKTINGIEENKMPGNGDLVAFAGEFKLDPDSNAPVTHGTQIASIIGSRGKIKPDVITGIAPGVKFIPIMNAQDDLISSWYFAVEGYDGSPGSGDEAQIVLTPFEYPRARDKGYDSNSRTADFFATFYSGGSTAFFGPGGDDGFGYGTVASPAASPGIITVGRTVDNSPLSIIYSGVEGSNIHYKDIAFRSSRGPTASGFPKPDIVAIGNSPTDIPITSGTTGVDAYDAFGPTGSEVSAALAAGTSALMLEAAGRGGKSLNTTTIRNYLMSGAENLGHDILLQGAGFLNASRSMRLLMGNLPRASVLVSPPSWVPGLYKDSRPEAFTKLLFPGEGDTASFKVENRDSSALTLTVTGDVLEKWGNYSFSNKTMQKKFGNDLFLWVNRSGVFVEDATLVQPLQIAPPIDPAIWNNSELLKLTAYGLFDDFVIPFGTEGYANTYCYDLELQDWEWEGSLLGFPSFSLSPSYEFNTIDSLAQASNVLEGRVSRPGTEIHDALVFKLVGHQNNDGCRKSNLVWRFTIDFYRRQPWSWLGVFPSTLNLSPGVSSSVTATVTVPADTAMGSYEAAIYIKDAAQDHEVTVPVLVNIGARSPNFVFGGNLPATDLHDVNRIYGGRDLFVTSPTSGVVMNYYLADWRFFYILLPDEGINVAGASIKMVVQLNWTVKPSDIDLMAMTPSPAADLASNFASGRFGPKSVREVAASEGESKARFKTLSNSSQDYISFQLLGGLNVIGLKEMMLNGDKPYETFRGSGMWWRVPREMRKATQRLNGTISGEAMTSADLFGGLRAAAVGPAVSSKNSSEIIKQDWQDWMRALSFQLAIAKGSYSYCIILEKVVILDIKLTGQPDVNDLDMGVFRDLNGDCKLDEATETQGAYCQGLNCVGGTIQWAMSAGPTADEEIKWTDPPDGKLIIKILGFDVPAGVGHFDLEVQQTLKTSTGYNVPEALPPEEIVQGTKPVLPSFKIVHFSMAFDFPGDQKDGNYSGAVRLGTATASGVVTVPVMVVLDRLPPTITSFAVLSPSKLVNNTNPSLTNDAQPSLVVTFVDKTMGTVDRSTFRMTLDGKDVTELMRVTLALENSPYVTPPTVGPWGYWRGDIKYDPLAALDDGVHVLYIMIGDEARNYVHRNFTFTVDRLSPSLSLTDPGTEYTRLSSTLIRGHTEASAYVQVGGAWHQAGLTGEFSIPVSLIPGNNLFDVTATNWFMTTKEAAEPANPVTIQKRVVYDTLSPTLVGRSTEPSGSLVNVDSVRLTGRVADNIANNSPLDSWLLNVTVNGDRVQVLPDGSFSTLVNLQEGQNSIAIVVSDPAGNNETSAPIVIVKDTVVPAIDCTNVPSKVDADHVLVSVTSEKGLKVTVNGRDATESDGTYSEDVSLSPGSNLIVVRAEDRAKNVAEVRLSVVYSAPSGIGDVLFGPGGGAGAIAFMILLVMIVIMAVFMLMRFVVRRGGPEEEAEEVPAEEAHEEVETPPKEIAPEEEAPEQAVQQPPQEEAPREEMGPEEIEEEVEAAIAEEEARAKMPSVERPPEEAERPVSTLMVYHVTRAKRALDEGRISRRVYEQNIASLGLTMAEADGIVERVKREEEVEAVELAKVPRPPPPPPQAGGPEVRAAKLKAAYEAGKIPREVYVQNLSALGLPVPPELEEQPEVRKGPTKEDKIRALRKALDEGRIDLEVYEENLRRLEES